MCSLTALAPADVPPDQGAAPVRRPHRVAERGAGDDLGQLELVAAGHEDGVDVAEPGRERRVVRLRPRLGSQPQHRRRPPASRNTASYASRISWPSEDAVATTAIRAAVAAGQPDELAQHDPRPGAVLGAADDAEGAGRDGADRSQGHGCERRGRGGAGHDVGMDSAPRLLVIVRHGKAESGEEGSDHDRRLTSRGLSATPPRPAAGWPDRWTGSTTPGCPRRAGPSRPGRPSQRVAARGGRGGRRPGTSTRPAPREVVEHARRRPTCRCRWSSGTTRPWSRWS